MRAIQRTVQRLSALRIALARAWEVSVLTNLVLSRAAAAHPDDEACVVLLDALTRRPDAPPLSGSWEGPIAVGGRSVWVAAMALDTALMLAEQGSPHDARTLVQPPPAGFVWGLYLSTGRTSTVVALYPRSHQAASPHNGSNPSDA